MAINFPASPSLNDTFTSGGVTYTWDGTVWAASGSAAFVLKSGDTLTGDLSAVNLTASADLTAVKGTFSTGVLFGTDTAAANTLDDYEEGSWTPTVSGGTTYSYQHGRYTKIGNRVAFKIFLEVSATPSSAGFAINGLPYAAATGEQGYATFGRGWANGWATNSDNLQYILNPGTQYIAAYTTPSSGSVGAINSNDMGSNGNLILAGVYMTD